MSAVVTAGVDQKTVEKPKEFKKFAVQKARQFQRLMRFFERIGYQLKEFKGFALQKARQPQRLTRFF